MKIEVVDKSKSEIELVFSEVDHHSVGNLLKDELLKSNNVTFAAYKRDHPLEDKSHLFVRAKSAPEAAVKNATKRISDDLAEFKKSFANALK
ncbi:MAG: DNA-directed RNA polymerase subunit L [Candidatus Nanoarchaeia archaeon]|nr:DNA-directed RNA polymerase subunit L [Candidatus Nanoarchaeia archaeon]